MRVLLIAGTHGVEPQSSSFLSSLFKTHLKNSFAEAVKAFSISSLLGMEPSEFEEAAIPLQVSALSVAPEAIAVEAECSDFLSLSELKLVLIPVINPWGMKNFTRHNASGVDLNRNMPSQNWQSAKLNIDGERNPYYPGDFPASELEVQILVHLIERLKFDLIFSFHTNHFVRYPNPPQINYDGHGKYRDFAVKLAEFSKLEFTEDIGYPTPGSLGSYAKDKGLDCITVEFDDNVSGEQAFQEYAEAFSQMINSLFVRTNNKIS